MSFRTVQVELDYYDLLVLSDHARERISESRKALRAEEKAGTPNSIPACMYRESLGNWKFTLARLNKGVAEIKRQQRAARAGREAAWSANGLRTTKSAV